MDRLLRRLVLVLLAFSLFLLLAFTALHAQPKPITQVSPPPGAIDVWLGTTIRVTFAVPMDRASVESRFVIVPAVTGAFVWSTDPRGEETIEFRPDDILAAETTYTVTLQAGLQDARGQVVLDTDYTWPFKTQRSYQAINFGYGVPVQLVDPDGRNSVQFWAGYPRIRVDFALYALPAADFAARYGELEPDQDEPIDVTGLIRVAAWQQSFGDEGYSFREAVLPDVPSGIYVLVASHPYAGQDELYVVVSRYVLALKRGVGGQVVAWVMKLQDQAPATGVTVTLYDPRGIPITQGVTDAKGVAELDAGTGDARMAIGQTEDAITLAGLDGAWRTGYGYWYWWWRDSFPTEAYRVYLYTDRPIYRPGHTVHFAAILRRDLDGAYTPVETSQPVTVTLRDSRDNVVNTATLFTDDFGSVDGSFTLAAEPPMGTYHIELEVDGQTHRQEFRVEAYRKPEYQVDVTTSAPYAVAGDPVTVTVQADYFFGQPVAGAEVVLKVFRRVVDWYWWQPSDGEQIAELRGVTDRAGRWTTTFTTDGQLAHDAVYTFAATVTDASRQPVEGRQAVQVCWNTFRLTLTTDKYGYQPGEPIVAKLTTHGHDGTPVAGVPVTVTVWRDYPERQIVARQQVTTDARGQAQATFSSLPQGWYRLTAEALDDRGRWMEVTRYVWVYDRSGWWWYSSDDDLSITADREAYAPGDTAQLLIESRVTGVALLTLERGAVYAEQVVPINGPATTVEVPISEDFAPNVFATVHIFQPGKGDYGYGTIPEGRLLTAQVELPVSAESHHLSVSVTPDADQYRPGDQAVFTIQVTDASGDPVEALVGLALVDEAIFALSADLSADIFETFYGRRSNTVVTYDSLTPRRYFWGFPEDWRGGIATPTPTGTPGVVIVQPTPTVPGKEVGQGLRQEFRDTAYWNPTIRTGSDGRAEVTVDLPDNLTTWRVIARAVTLDTLVGDATTSILVTKEIITRPALPRFTVLGDRFALDVIAQNFSGQDLTGTASLDAPGLVVLDPGPRSLELPNVGTDVARWTAVAAEAGLRTITCTVDTPAGGDSVVLPLRTQPFAVPERWSAAGQANPIAVERFQVPFNAVHQATELTVRLSPSVALGVLDGLDALINYPYGCVEQTMSRVLPSAVAAKAYQDLGIPNPKADVLPEVIHQGVQRLYGFQHEDGGWGWWYDDEGNVYMTAYVLFGLTMVQQAGFEVESSVLDRGFGFLNSRLRTVDDPRVLAYALYVKSVAGRGDLAAARALLSQQDKLDPFARAALALTLNAEGDPQAAQMLVDHLISEVVETPTTAYWPRKADDGTQYHWRTLSSTEKNTAMALRALVALRPDHRLAPKAVRWLMDHRRGAGWRDTQATAFAVLSLVDYIRVSGELQANYQYTVTLNGQVIANGEVTPATVTNPIDPIVVHGSDLRDGENEIRVARDGPGQLYYSLALHLELFYDGFEPVSSLDQGLVITRTYRLVEGATHPGPIGGAGAGFGSASHLGNDGTYSVGDLVEVRLTLEVRDEAWYVVVEDPLPAGFEALNERLNPVSYGDSSGPWRWYEWGYNRKDIYDDHVTFFVTHLWPGRRALTYLMRATTPGEFSALPAQAYPMYEEIWGRSASHQLRVSPEGLAARPALAGDFDRDCRVTAFDSRQVAGAWGTTARARDLDADGDVDLRDVVAVAGRQGATCLADQALPGAGEERVAFSIRPEVKAVPLGQAFNVDVTLDELTNLGGFELTVTFDPARLRLVGVALDPALDDALSLGPRMDHQAGRVSFGALATPSTVTNSHLATITFVGRQTGETRLTVGDVEAVDGQGRTLEVGAVLGGSIRIGNTALFFPLVAVHSDTAP